MNYGNVIEGLRKDACYLIVVEDVKLERVILKYQPVIMPVTWSQEYQFEVNVVAGKLERMTEIEIENDIINSASINGEEIFVYRIKGYDDEGNVFFTKVVDMPVKLEENTQKSIKVEVKSGYEYQIEEIYSGSRSSLRGGEAIQSVISEPEEIVGALFVYQTTGGDVSGCSNSYTFVKDGEKIWNSTVVHSTSNNETSMYSKVTSNLSAEATVNINSGAPEDAYYIRVKCFTDCSNLSIGANKWVINTDDGYFYYSDIVQKGKSSQPISIMLENDNREEINLIIVTEVTKVRYHEEGNTYAEWESLEEAQ